MNWLSKYMPQCWDDLLIHDKERLQMEQWIQEVRSKKTTDYFLYLCGPAGCGKTTMANLLLKKYGYDIIEWNAIDLKQVKAMEDTLVKAIYKQNINILIQDKKVTTGIILEECDCLQNTGKDTLTKVTESIYVLDAYVPIICTSNEKECDDIKNGRVIHMKGVSREYINTLIHTIETKEKFTMCKDVKDYIHTKLDTDMRSWIMNLESIYMYFRSKKKDFITLRDIKMYFETTQTKDKDYSLYEWTKRIFDKDVCSLSSKVLVEISKNDSVIFPMMVYSNLEYKSKNNIDFLKQKNNMCQVYLTQEIFREYNKKTHMFSNLNDDFNQYGVYYSIGTTIVHHNHKNIDVNSEIHFPSNIYNKKYTECTHRKHLNLMQSEYDISKSMVDYWSYMMYFLYLSHESSYFVDMMEYYKSIYNYEMTNEKINDIFKSDYLREEIKKRKKENILKTIYGFLNVDVKKSTEKKKRGRPKKTNIYK